MGHTRNSRRHFVKTLSTVALSLPLMSRASLLDITAGDEKKVYLQTFSYGDVELTGGVLKQQFDRILKIYTALDNDSLLKPMREGAGMPAPGRDLGGWYDEGKGLGHLAPGHCFGQLLSAYSKFYAVTKDKNIKIKVEQLVKGFDETIRPDGPFFKNLRYPAYTFDKHVLGLTDAYRFAGVKSAIEVLDRAYHQALPYLPEKALTRKEMAERPHRDFSYAWDESYILPENLFNAYEVTGDKKYKVLAERFLHDKPYFIPLSKGINALAGEHAYSHMNALSSAAKAYEALGSEMHLKAITNAWDMIEAGQQYASGGWGPNETFIEPGKGLLAKSLYTTGNHFEAPCGSYAHSKLGRYLIRFTGNSRYGDNMERMIYNASLAVKDPKEDGSAFYYLNHKMQAKKEYHPDRCPCCFGGLSMVVSEYPQNIYFHNEDEIFINMYTSSILNWNKNSSLVKIEQVTDYPNNSESSFHISMPKPAKFSMNFRIPSWTEDKNVEIEINGKMMSFKGKSGSFYAVERTWKDGDHITVKIPLIDYTLPIDDQNPNIVAFMHGPLMLVGLEPELKLADQQKAEIIAGGNIKVKESTVTLKPLYLVKDEIYTSYFHI